MEFLSYLISGISLGSIYAIIALGYTMVYGIAKMLNFAHGDVIMVGGYISFCAVSYMGLPGWLSVIIAMAVCTVLGIVIEGLAYKPLRQATSLAVLITAIGVSYFLQNAALLIWGASPKVYTPIVSGQIAMGDLKVSWVTIVTVIACIIIAAGLTIFTSRTKMGKAMRACSEDKGAAQLMGINVTALSPPPLPLAPLWQPSQAFCFALSLPLLCLPPAPCPVSRPSPLRYSAASAPFPAHSLAVFCWALSPR